MIFLFNPCAQVKRGISKSLQCIPCISFVYGLRLINILDRKTVIYVVFGLSSYVERPPSPLSALPKNLEELFVSLVLDTWNNDTL